MRKIIITTLILLIATLTAAIAQTESLKVSNIADSMKQNAYAVVRFSNEIFEYKSDKLGIRKVSKAVTILDEKGEEAANFRYYGDKNNRINFFSAKIYDGEGKELRKYRLSDVRSTEYSEGLADDSQYYYFDCESPVIPFTILYEYEISRTNGHLSFVYFFPQNSFNMSVESASSSILIPPGMKILTHNSGNKVSEPEQSGTNISQYKWSVKDLKAVESESFMPDLDSTKYFPKLLVRPEKFVYDGVPGEFRDWVGMGRWEYTLLKDRDILPEDAKTKIMEVVKDCPTDRDKVKALYDYLGRTTRYVSIQLGIGGYQPMSAADVYKKGFGDCKALSNYMMAMLKVVDIKSYYTPIRMDDWGNNKLIADYPNFNQMNHVIVEVPLKGDTVWLECTNPRVPFGYVHESIAGKEALEVSSEGGKIVRLPDYADTLNVEKNLAKIEIAADGTAKAITTTEYFVKAYDQNMGIVYQPAVKQTERVRKYITLPNVTMGKLQITENKTELPSMKLNYDWTTNAYGNKSGNRLFIPVNPFRRSVLNLKKGNRTHDLDLKYGFKDVDSLIVNIPEGYEIEAMPKPLNVESKYGSFVSKIEKTENGIEISHTLIVNSGIYPADKYADFIAFTEQVNSAYGSRIILRKKQ